MTNQQNQSQVAQAFEEAMIEREPVGVVDPNDWRLAPLNDDLSDLLAGLPNASAPALPPADPQLARIREQGIGEVPAKPVFKEPCGKCGGSGRYYGHTSLGHNYCTLCKGKGFKTYKASPEKRAANREASARREANKADSNWDGWKARNPTQAAWIEANPTFGFAVAMKEAVRKWRDLTVNQTNAVDRCVAASAAREQARAAAAAQRPAPIAVNVEAIAKALQTAKTNGLSKPTLRLGDFIFKPGKAFGRYEGCTLVTSRSRKVYGLYGEQPALVGHIDKEGLFHAARACTEEDKAGLLAVSADPVAAAVRYGRDIGECSCCGRTLTDPESVARGIGPICAENFGF